MVSRCLRCGEFKEREEMESRTVEEYPIVVMCKDCWKKVDEMDDVITEKKLLELLNKYLKADSKARRLQTKFENALAAFSGIEREDLSMVMDTYIDFDIAGVPSATLIDVKAIIAQSTKHGRGRLV